MKPALVIITVLILASCNKTKNYTCNCDIHDGTNYSRETKEIKAKSGTEAEQQCREFGASVANGAHVDCSTQ